LELAKAVSRAFALATALQNERAVSAALWSAPAERSGDGALAAAGRVGKKDHFPGTLNCFPGALDRFLGPQDSFPGAMHDFPGTLDEFPGTLDDFPGTLDDFPGALETSRARWMTSRARWMSSRARWTSSQVPWITSRVRWITSRARWITSRARWITSRARWITSRVPLPAAWELAKAISNFPTHPKQLASNPAVPKSAATGCFQHSGSCDSVPLRSQLSVFYGFKITR
jgi:hypothetical protein